MFSGYPILHYKYGVWRTSMAKVYLIDYTILKPTKSRDVFGKTTVPLLPES